VQEIRRDEQVRLEYQFPVANDRPFIHTARSQAGTDQLFVFDDQWLVGGNQSLVVTGQ